MVCVVSLNALDQPRVGLELKTVCYGKGKLFWGGGGETRMAGHRTLTLTFVIALVSLITLKYSYMSDGITGVLAGKLLHFV